MTLNTENRDPGKGHGVGLLPCGEGRGYIIKIIMQICFLKNYNKKGGYKTRLNFYLLKAINLDSFG